MNNAIRFLTVFVILGWLASCAHPTPTPVSTVIVPIGDLVSERNHIPLAHELFELLAQEEYAAVCDRLSPDLKERLTPEKLEEAWKKVTSEAGPYQKVAGSIIEQVNGREKVTITGEYAHGFIDLKLFFEEGHITGLFVAPGVEPVSFPDWTPPGYSFQEAFVEIDIVVGREWSLPGTLTLPVGDGPFPAVVLVHGSGPQDRDETLGPNKPFRDLAWGLASQGIAVLRYDKRTLVHSERLLDRIDYITIQEETVEDALLAVLLLRQTDLIDPERIFVLGHSLGGMLVPLIGAGDTDIAGFIIMAGAALPWEDKIFEQVSYILNLDGPPTQEQQQYLNLLGKQVDQIKNLEITSDTPPDELLGLPSSYWLALRDYDPAEHAKTLKRPTLIIQGGRDYQVTEEDFNCWKQALERESWAEFILYPSLNHLFIGGEGIITPAEYSEPGHVAEEVVDDILAFIRRR
jgi:uncharacterized protein